MKIRINIVKAEITSVLKTSSSFKEKGGDTMREVSKVIIYDSEKRVLFLEKNKNKKKAFDLPGGHLEEGETAIKGAKRETLEELGLNINEPVFYKKQGRVNFFFTQHNNQKIMLSDEHRDFFFLERAELDESDEFQKIALEILDVVEGGH